MLMMLGGCRLWHAAVKLSAADAHDAWFGWTPTVPRSSGLPLMLMMLGCLPLMLMMLGLVVDTGSTVVEQPAADAHDAWWLSTLEMPR